jgi:hypothetical protein
MSRLRPTFGPLAITLIALAAIPAVASAAAPELLWQAPEDGQLGFEAGRLDIPEGVATDPISGHVYVSDHRNSRVSEYDAWGEFVKAWGWGVRDGSAELQTCGPQAVPPIATCLKGIAGGGPGQLDLERGGIAVGAAGDIYVGDLTNHRVQKFDPQGNFLLMFGGEVDKTTSADVCTAASGDTCGIGSQGEGDGEFQTIAFGRYVVTGPGGTIFVGDAQGRIQEFDDNGAFMSKVTLGGELAGRTMNSLAMDSAGDFYALPALASSTPTAIFKFSPSGAPLPSISAELTTESSLAVDAADNLYATVANDQLQIQEVVSFGPDGAPIIPAGSGIPLPNEILGTGLATNTVTATGGVDVYLTAVARFGLTDSYISAYGPPPDKWQPPKFPPEIRSQYAGSVEADTAVVGAEINPKFWADTAYYLEYGTGKCSEGGCPTVKPAPPGTELGAGVTSAPVASKGVLLTGLQPHTTYHYRFIAKSSGGGPTIGVGETHAEATFTTPALPAPPNVECPNQVFRAGSAARLADCRAYEMVSPVDKNNTDIVSLININSNAAALNQSAASGEKLTYTTSQGFADAQGVPYVSQYIASRGPGGWSNHNITPPQGLSPVLIGQRIEIEFRAFSADLCAGALFHPTDEVLAAGAVEGFANLYLRHNCGLEGYEALTTSEPPTQSATTYLPEIQGLSADGGCTVFAAADQLTPDAAPTTARQLYESCGGSLHLLSVLVNGTANPKESTAGTGSPTFGFRSGTGATAVSADGSRVYWTAPGEGPGKLYVRINASEPQSKVSAGKCTEAEKACTIRVSETVTNTPAHFWSASADGGKALFTIEGATPIQNTGGSGELYEFDLASKSSTPIAGDVTGVLGASEDASRVFFVSKETLTGANAQGASPTLGEPNLYLFDAGGSGGASYRFVATPSEADAIARTNLELTPTNIDAFKKTSRVSPDGAHLAFMSTAGLTGYDNTDADSGEADAEIYAYDATVDGGAGVLRCVSCNPSGQRPTGRNLPMEGQPSGTWAAALLPPYATELYGSRAISDDGSRVFFDSYEALLPDDTNGKADVYQWEAPGSDSGEGRCTGSSPAYSSPNGGCLSLISAGKSPSDSEFIDASPDGRDVFFATASSLLPQDPGLIDIYDARAGGGYPPPPGQSAACEGEACQGAPAVPSDPTPASATFKGRGNVREGGSVRSRCAKGKVRRKIKTKGKVRPKSRCVAKQHRKRAAQTGSSRTGER